MLVEVRYMFHSPSIVPEETDVYLVLDDFGNRLGRVWRETDEADTDRATLISYLLQGQYANPARIVVFNTVEGWSRDATEDIVAELVELCRDRDRVPPWLRDLVQGYLGSRRPCQLALRP
jgi:hypothetical protein